ncbi:unnamed protein product [Spirodela intermedia]|uniref:Uncharacterized protein n=1 Tax=Spirodela intermedia TaxID=51605 RepID=A0ABN7EBY9_SPIIN|nr:unnamed protein product [Spirodela intermedia]
MREIEISTIIFSLSDSLSLACTTTPCPTASWPPMTWKGSDVHVPSLVLSRSSPCSRLSLTTLLTHLRAQLPGGIMKKNMSSTYKIKICLFHLNL